MSILLLLLLCSHAIKCNSIQQWWSECCSHMITNLPARHISNYCPCRSSCRCNTYIKKQNRIFCRTFTTLTGRSESISYVKCRFLHCSSYTIRKLIASIRQRFYKTLCFSLSELKNHKQVARVPAGSQYTQLIVLIGPTFRWSSYTCWLCSHSGSTAVYRTVVIQQAVILFHSLMLEL